MSHTVKQNSFSLKLVQPQPTLGRYFQITIREKVNFLSFQNTPALIFRIM